MPHEILDLLPEGKLLQTQPCMFCCFPGILWGHLQQLCTHLEIKPLRVFLAEILDSALSFLHLKTSSLTEKINVLVKTKQKPFNSGIFYSSVKIRKESKKSDDEARKLDPLWVLRCTHLLVFSFLSCLEANLSGVPSVMWMLGYNDEAESLFIEIIILESRHRYWPNTHIYRFVILVVKQSLKEKGILSWDGRHQWRQVFIKREEIHWSLPKEQRCAKALRQVIPNCLQVPLSN